MANSDGGSVAGQTRSDVQWAGAPLFSLTVAFSFGISGKGNEVEVVGINRVPKRGNSRDRRPKRGTSRRYSLTCFISSYNSPFYAEKTYNTSHHANKEILPVLRLAHKKGFRYVSPIGLPRCD